MYMWSLKDVNHRVVMQNQARNMIHVDTNIAKRRIIFEEISNKHHSKLKRFLRRFHSEHNVCVFDVFEY